LRKEKSQSVAIEQDKSLGVVFEQEVFNLFPRARKSLAIVLDHREVSWKSP